MSAEVFQCQIRVTYAHCTVGNHVYYARYLDFLEAARGEFFRHLENPCLTMQEADITFPVIGLDLNYKNAARYDDVLSVQLSIEELRGPRLTFNCRILNQNGDLILQGRTRHACASVEGKPKRIPQTLADRLLPYLSPETDAP